MSRCGDAFGGGASRELRGVPHAARLTAAEHRIHQPLDRRVRRVEATASCGLTAHLASTETSFLLWGAPCARPRGVPHAAGLAAPAYRIHPSLDVRVERDPRHVA